MSSNCRESNLVFSAPIRRSSMPGAEEKPFSAEDAREFIDCLSCQIDEIRKLNRRLEMSNHGLQVHNSQLQEENRILHQLQEANKILEIQLDLHVRAKNALRYRIVDRAHQAITRYPLIRR